ncbi:hypothetical protein [Methylobacterium frigidaeris]|uniref:Uncharacterized protein n=1 Tax=Methylobacterium frigidaeris TaxID=2038277 RepID=A0AA37HI78_9HYPH|nr:hypothetical protein [Methylobacterium frigidaeris]PIK71052.1 hypothetical protein CS379_21400 [Methylobacterium frigidaeris]GJD66597.1 hypothetical protein MPEAHAMD_6795 [Methylobacterium frigidaeris]
MPSLNLRNPFRRDGSSQPLRQRAAILKAAAARVIRREPSPLGAANPVLAALEAEFQAANAALSEADAALGEVQAPFEEPDRPKALEPQRRDWMLHSIPRPDVMQLADRSLKPLHYGLVQVEELRGRRHMKRAHGFGDWVPDPMAQARGDGIVAAWDAWQAEVEAAKQAAGIPPRLAAWEAALDHRDEVLERIHQTPARSLADFALKARIASTVCKGEPLSPADRRIPTDYEDAMPYAIAAELLALSGDRTATGA